MKIRTDPRTGMKYADYMLGGKRHRVSLGTKNKEVAIIKAAKLIEDKDQQKESSMLFALFWEKYFNYAKASFRPASVSTLKQMKNKLFLFGEPKTLADITPKYADDFKIWLVSSGLNKTSVNMLMGYFKTMIATAEAWGLSNTSLRSVKKLKTEHKPIEFHTVEEIRQIMAVAPSIEWEVLVHFAARTGLRQAELARLKWEDITFIGQTACDIYVGGESKNYDFRTVPVRDKKLTEHLQVLKKFYHSTGKDRVFRHVGTVQTLGHNYLKWTKKLEFKCFLHKLRHTYASHLAQKDTRLQKIKMLLGHKSINSTMRYAHLLPSDLPSSVENLEEI